MLMQLDDCHNIDDFRRLAKRRLPWPVFDYIDGAADADNYILSVLETAESENTHLKIDGNLIIDLNTTHRMFERRLESNAPVV